MTNPLKPLEKQLEYTLSRTHTSEDYIEALHDAVNACNLGSVAALEQWIDNWTDSIIYTKGCEDYQKGVEFVEQEWHKITRMF